MQQLDLTGDSWTLSDQEGHRVPAQVPGCAMGALVSAGLVADPLAGRNEAAATWVDERIWTWQRDLELSAAFLAHERIDLVAEGLDVLTGVHLGSQRVGRTANRFRTWRWEVGKLLRSGARELRVVCDPATPELRRRSPERDLYGVPSPIEVLQTGWLRTSACQFGWDWGPRVAGCGLHGTIALVGWSIARIDAVSIIQHHGDGQVAVEFTVDVRRTHPEPLQALIAISLSGRMVVETHLTITSDRAALRLPIPEPQMWWPNGHGAQPLYQVTLTLRHGAMELDRWSRRLGLREITLVREHDAIGQSFGFVVNGVPLVAKGANWIPPHPIPERSPLDMRERLFAGMRAAHFTMLRIWGGGVYEDDAFYDRCDELGILVWQDLMMACAHVPLHDEEWVENLEQEVRDQVGRLRHHACIALWCGNNEFEMGGVSWQSNDGRMDWDDYQRLFDRRLPQLIRTLDPQRAWWPCSPHTPLGDRSDDADPTCGDSHQWGVWAFNQPITSVAATIPRFVSEFGFQSFPELTTLLTVMPVEEIVLGHPGLDHRQRAGAGGTTRMLRELAEWLPVPTTIDRLARATQMLQGIYLDTAIRAWRRHPDRCRGQLYWQINDTWPGLSWSTIDHLGTWKLSHAVVARAFAPLLLTLSADAGTGLVSISLTSDIRQAVTGTLTWRVVSSMTGEDLRRGSLPVACPGPGSREICSMDCSELRRTHGDDGILAVGEVIWDHGETSRHHSCFVRPRELQLKPAQLQVSRDPSGLIRVSALSPAYGVYLEADDSLVPDTGQADVLLPGSPWMIAAAGPAEASLGAFCLHIPR